MKKRRDSFIQFFTNNYQLIQKTLLPFLGIILLPLQAMGDYEYLVKISFWVLVGFILLASFLKWRNRTFEIKDRMIRISEGVIRKEQNDIPFNRIKSVNTSDTIVKRIFNVSDLNVELIGGSEVAFVMSNKEVLRIKQEIFQFTETVVEHNEPKNKKNHSFFHYFLMGVSNRTVYLASVSIMTAVFSVGLKVVEETLGLEEGNGEWEVMSQYSLSTLLLTGILTMTFFFIAGIIVSTLVAYLTYGNFKIDNLEKEMTIKYGFLNKKNYLVPKKQVRSLSIEESYILSWFGYAQLRIHNIGYGSGDQSMVVVSPLIKKSEIEEFLTEYLPDMANRRAEMKPKKTGIPHYIWIQTKKPLVYVAIVWFINNELWWLSLSLILFAWIGYNKWKAAGFSFDEEYVTVSYGTYLGFKTMVTPKQYVESTSYGTTLFGRRGKTGFYRFAVYSERLSETYGCGFITDKRNQEFLDYLNR